MTAHARTVSIASTLGLALLVALCGPTIATCQDREQDSTEATVGTSTQALRERAAEVEDLRDLSPSDLATLPIDRLEQLLFLVRLDDGRVAPSLNGVMDLFVFGTDETDWGELSRKMPGTFSSGPRRPGGGALEGDAGCMELGSGDAQAISDTITCASDGEGYRHRVDLQPELPDGSGRDRQDGDETNSSNDEETIPHPEPEAFELPKGPVEGFLEGLTPSEIDQIVMENMAGWYKQPGLTDADREAGAEDYISISVDLVWVYEQVAGDSSEESTDQDDASTPEPPDSESPDDEEYENPESQGVDVSLACKEALEEEYQPVEGDVDPSPEDDSGSSYLGCTGYGLLDFVKGCKADLQSNPDPGSTLSSLCDDFGGGFIGWRKGPPSRNDLAIDPLPPGELVTVHFTRPALDTLFVLSGTARDRGSSLSTDQIGRIMFHLIEAVSGASDGAVP